MELFRALAVLTEAPREETEAIAGLIGLERAPTAAEHTELFALQLVPYGSVYLGAEGMLGGAARDRVAGFWRALGEVPPAEPDHLAVLLALYAHLADLDAAEQGSERSESIGRARAALLWEHLLSWLPVYLDKLVAVAAPPLAEWGRLLDEALEREAAAVPAPPGLPLHLREAPPLDEASVSSSGELLGALLAPARSGMIITRSDVARAAVELGLGLRAGERRYALQAMLEQDADAVLGWLAGEARRCAAAHGDREAVLGEVARFWSERADRTAATLTALLGAQETMHAGSAANEHH